MLLQFTPYVPLFASAALIALLLTFILIGKRKAPGTRSLRLLMMTLTFWLGTYTLELVSANPAQLIFWAKTQYIGIAFIGVLWFVFARQFTGNTVKDREKILLSIIPVITIVVVFTNEFHGLMWHEINLETIPYLRFSGDYGYWFYVHTVYAYGLVISGSLSIIINFWRAPGQYQGQVRALMLAALLPLFGSVLFVTGVLGNLDATPLAILLSGGLLTWAMYRFELFDMVPVARHIIVDSMKEGIIVIDNKQRIVDANPAAQTILKAPDQSTPTPLIGKDIRTILAPYPELSQSIEQLESDVLERCELAAGVFDVHVSSFQRSGRLQGRLAVFRDVSLRAQAEAEMRRAKEVAESAMIAKSQFLATMSHELRTPLTAIIGFTELLSEELYGPLNAPAKDGVNEIMQASKHLLGLIDDVIDFAQIEEQKITPTVVTMSPFLLDIAATYASRARAKNVQFDVNIPADLHVLMTDGRCLRQVVYHLLNNALKFTHSGRICFQAERREDAFVISVTDTGIGIDPENFEMIFEGFKQVDGSETRRYGGSGLGLAISRRYTELLGGKLTVKSQVGKGSSFRIYLPVQSNEAMRKTLMEE